MFESPHFVKKILKSLDKPKFVPGTPVCGTPKRLRLILSPRSIVSVIVTAIAECNLVGCILVGVIAGLTT
jgi:hypothetical protein